MANHNCMDLPAEGRGRILKLKIGFQRSVVNLALKDVDVMEGMIEGGHYLET